jgi:hypothetical protein
VRFFNPFGKACNGEHFCFWFGCFIKSLIHQKKKKTKDYWTATHDDKLLLKDERRGKISLPFYKVT